MIGCFDKDSVNHFVQKNSGSSFFSLKSRKPGDCLLFDGAMGTLHAKRKLSASSGCEMDNLEHPSLIVQIHKDYLDAGAMALKTNTFSLSDMMAAGQESLARDILQAACFNARQAVLESEADASVFADIGPIGQTGKSSPEDIYCQQADWFLDQGIDCFLAETQYDLQGIEQLGNHIKSRNPDAVFAVSFAVGPDFTTRTGHKGRDLLDAVMRMECVDGAGFNCSSGPHHLLSLVQKLPEYSKPLLLMPNAGYPQVLGRKTAYKGSPDYFASVLSQARGYGVSVFGGCCGTTPEHIRALKAELEKCIDETENVSSSFSPDHPPYAPSAFFDKMEAGARPIAVELDPPDNDKGALFVESAGLLQKAGASLLTVADCPIGRPRADSSMLAAFVSRETGCEVLPHMTCRDRNLNAARALLLGLSMEGVHNLLLVTGDPLPTDLRDEVKAVFSCNSRGLARYILSLPSSVLSRSFRLYGALDINAVNFDVQLRLAKEKEQAGMIGFFTQPVLSARGLENLKRARKELKGTIAGGIFPVISRKNALFLTNEISGMDIDERIADLYEGLNREQAEDLAIKISLEAARAMKDSVDAWYLMTPFQRTGLMVRLIQALKSEGLSL